jgi:hypothetical protein
MEQLSVSRWDNNRTVVSCRFSVLSFALSSEFGVHLLGESVDGDSSQAQNRRAPVTAAWNS